MDDLLLSFKLNEEVSLISFKAYNEKLKIISFIDQCLT